ncbi:hypothetical protein [Marilutibacter maris]|uniref:Uncharacterized protein n=1 Tax=Marilutibacter maris TaxID=1605891 RepID=A0A2U9T8E7_9GAMM|nr:hypothetical protein [Lysobacter maris]AWV08823.1 hypothetical protein C9I47_3159 [Lysobacter maris]
MPRLCAYLLSLLLAAPAFGQTVVPPEVVSVVSGGHWEANGCTGTYRVVVVNDGFEHVVSHALVQWVAAPSSPDESPSVVASVEPPLPFGQGVASLIATLKPMGSGQVGIRLSGSAPAAPNQEVGTLLIAREPGVVAVQGD